MKPVFIFLITTMLSGLETSADDPFETSQEERAQTSRAEKKFLLVDGTQPKNITQVTAILLKKIPGSEIKKIRNSDDLGDNWVNDQHAGLGRFLRNTWKLWDKNTDLHKYFIARNIVNPDDMSRLILKHFVLAVLLSES